MTMPRASFVSVLAFVAAVAGGSYLLELLATRVGVAVAHADTVPADAAAPAPDAAAMAASAGSAGGSGAAAPAAGSGSAAGSAVVASAGTSTITNADQLHDVITDPLAALSDVKSLYNVKLSLAVLAVLIILSRGVARFPGKVGAWFASGTRATVLAGGAAICVSCFNGLATGASWVTIVITAGVAAVALLHPVPAGAPNGGTKAA